MWACNVCASSDPTTDTVRVTFPEAQTAESRDEKQKQLEEQKRRQEEADLLVARRLALEEEENQKKADEQRRKEIAAQESKLQEAKEQRLQAQRIAEEQRRKEEEQRRKAEEDAKRQELQKKEEERLRLEKLAAEEKQKQEEAAAAKVQDFLKKNGFKGAAEKRSSFFSGASLPLHTAVKQNDANMVKMLILRGADRTAKLSGLTALDFAKKNDKNGSYAAVIEALTTTGGIGGA